METKLVKTNVDKIEVELVMYYTVGVSRLLKIYYSSPKHDVRAEYLKGARQWHMVEVICTPRVSNSEEDARIDSVDQEKAEDFCGGSFAVALHEFGVI